MKEHPIILRSPTDDGRRLERFEARAKSVIDEAWLQELLFRHPEILPVEHFDSSFAPPIPIGREVPTGRGPIDDLFVSPEGQLTLVETKLWKNPEKHRTVVAQIIDYAKEVATWGYDELCAAVLTSSRRRKSIDNPSLEEKVAASLAKEGVPLTDFQEGVAASLATGSFLLLIVGDRVSPNIALLTQAIRSAPGLEFTLGLVEMQLYTLDEKSEWPLIVVPEVVGKTVEHVRGVVQVRYVQEKPTVQIDIEDGGDGGPIGWKAFLNEVPPDLVETYEQAAADWKQLGGELHFTDKRVFWRIRLGEEQASPIRCAPNSICVVSRKAFDRWFPGSTLYPFYLQQLEASATATTMARNDKMWIRYEEISSQDLKIVLQAAMRLVERMQTDLHS